MTDLRSMQDMFNGTSELSVPRKSKPLLLADMLDADACNFETKQQAASELRRLHEENKALRQAIEQAEKQEPVAWMWKDGSLTTDPDYADGTWQPLYTAPLKREWVGLTDEDIDDLWKRDYFHLHYEFPKTIELILKEKNT